MSLQPETFTRQNLARLPGAPVVWNGRGHCKVLVVFVVGISSRPSVHDRSKQDKSCNLAKHSGSDLAAFQEVLIAISSWPQKLLKVSKDLSVASL